jgi:PAS domain S-box-containing protein
MHDSSQEKKWFWATLVLSSVSIVAFVFAFWELFENNLFRDLDYVSLHYLYISRGIASSLLLAMWAGWFVLRQRRIAEMELRRSRARYRGLLQASPGAVVLFDQDLRLLEWNATAVRLYGYSSEDVLGQTLPTVPPEKETELREFLAQVEAGVSVLDQETLRRDRNGNVFEVQLSLLPYRERGQRYFLEITYDIRERVRLRQTLIEVEKLTSMGRMAAGTAHHLNTPLASMLLRVQMMRERDNSAVVASDLERLENSIHFCQQFVRRLLDFTRRPSQLKQPEEISAIVEAVVGFLAPSFLAKRAMLEVSVDSAAGKQVLADRNQLEALLLILLSNAQDAIQAGGRISIACRPVAGDKLEIEVADNGCGISEADRQRLFEPFFTTKPMGKGTGLGLPMAQNIVSEHGGTIRLESDGRSGTRVYVQLPTYHSAAVIREVAR